MDSWINVMARSGDERIMFYCTNGEVHMASTMGASEANDYELSIYFHGFLPKRRALDDAFVFENNLTFNEAITLGTKIMFAFCKANIIDRNGLSLLGNPDDWISTVTRTLIGVDTRKTRGIASIVAKSWNTEVSFDVDNDEVIATLTGNDIDRSGYKLATEFVYRKARDINSRESITIKTNLSFLDALDMGFKIMREWKESNAISGEGVTSIGTWAQIAEEASDA